MAGIDMVRLAGNNTSARASAANAAGTSGSSKETSKAGFANMIRDKANESSGDSRESNTPVKNRKEPSGDKPVEKQEDKPVSQKEEKNAGTVGEETDLSGAVLELQAAVSQMLVQTVGEAAGQPIQQAVQEQLVAETGEQLLISDGSGQLPVSDVGEQVPAAMQADFTPQVGTAFPTEAQTENVKTFGEKLQQKLQPAEAVGKEKASESVRTGESPVDRAGEAQPGAAVPTLAKVRASGDSQRKETEGREGETRETGAAAQEVTASDAMKMAGTETREVFTPVEVRGDQVPVVKATPQTFGQDLGSRLASSLPKSNGTLTIELEPASLGKLTIRVVYEAGKAAVSIMSANPRTVELLSQNAGEIARILEEKTGQTTMVYTPDSRQPFDEGQAGQGQNQERQRQESQEHRKQNQTEAFTQMLRLGLV